MPAQGRGGGGVLGRVGRKGEGGAQHTSTLPLWVAPPMPGIKPSNIRGTLRYAAYTADVCWHPWPATPQLCQTIGSTVKHIIPMGLKQGERHEQTQHSCTADRAAVDGGYPAAWGDERSKTKPDTPESTPQTCLAHWRHNGVDIMSQVHENVAGQDTYPRGKRRRSSKINK